VTATLSYAAFSPATALATSSGSALITFNRPAPPAAAWSRPIPYRRMLASAMPQLRATAARLSPSLGD
jgi:hypothetical protein